MVQPRVFAQHGAANSCRELRGRPGQAHMVEKEGGGRGHGAHPHSVGVPADMAFGLLTA